MKPEGGEETANAEAKSNQFQSIKYINEEKKDRVATKKPRTTKNQRAWGALGIVCM